MFPSLACQSVCRSLRVPSERYFGQRIRLSVGASISCSLQLILHDYPADGRRLIYLWGVPFLCIGSYGVAVSTSLRGLLFWRFVQTFGCSGGLSLGAGVIGDIYKLEERGTGMGIFIGVRN